MTLHPYTVTTDTGMPLTFLATNLAEARQMYGPTAQPVKAAAAKAAPDTLTPHRSANVNSQVSNPPSEHGSDRDQPGATSGKVTSTEATRGASQSPQTTERTTRG